ncbi:TIGR03557 family F420-dependent LLM class oxidoreductase [Streptomyces sp. NPDC056191]|uniref:TIGR03557 family F420-dependent LLM class oxidoreductase n=1 Tax=Streptomyces sp. NPDC056191 TaxID=3345742 RepID=UPI0035E267E6
MMHIGYTMMTEQAGPRELVGHVVEAERVGFDFSVISDHSFPWLPSQGHAPYAWSVLGAAAQATSRIPLMTFVTCPSFRYHPVVVAQKAATVQLLSEGRFRLGLGSGENLNEHVVGRGWPSAPVRLAMLDEAAEIIRALLTGAYVTRHGRHFQVDDARLWDVPDTPPPLGIAVSGPRSCAVAGRHADLLIATEPERDLLNAFDARGGTGKPRMGQLPICYDPDRGVAVARAHDQFRWALGGWHVNAELPLPASFAQASAYTRPGDVAKTIPCGDDVGSVVESARRFADAGFTDLALVQVGGDHQMPFLRWAETTLLPALRDL